MKCAKLKGASMGQNHTNTLECEVSNVAARCLIAHMHAHAIMNCCAAIGHTRSYKDAFHTRLEQALGPAFRWPPSAFVQAQQKAAQLLRERARGSEFQKDVDASEEENARRGMWTDPGKRARWWQFLHNLNLSQPLLLQRKHLYAVQAIMQTITNVSKGVPQVAYASRQADAEILNHLFAFVERGLPVLKSKDGRHGVAEMTAAGFRCTDKSHRPLHDKFLLEHILHACISTAAAVVVDGVAHFKEQATFLTEDQRVGDEQHQHALPQHYSNHFFRLFNQLCDPSARAIRAVLRYWDAILTGVLAHPCSAPHTLDLMRDIGARHAATLMRAMGQPAASWRMKPLRSNTNKDGSESARQQPTAEEPLTGLFLQTLLCTVNTPVRPECSVFPLHFDRMTLAPAASDARRLQLEARAQMCAGVAGALLESDLFSTMSRQVQLHFGTATASDALAVLLQCVPLQPALADAIHRDTNLVKALVGNLKKSVLPPDLLAVGVAAGMAAGAAAGAAAGEAVQDAAKAAKEVAQAASSLAGRVTTAGDAPAVEPAVEPTVTKEPAAKSAAMMLLGAAREAQATYKDVLLRMRQQFVLNKPVEMRERRLVDLQGRVLLLLQLVAARPGFPSRLLELELKLQDLLNSEWFLLSTHTQLWAPSALLVLRLLQDKGTRQKTIAALNQVHIDRLIQHIDPAAELEGVQTSQTSDECADMRMLDPGCVGYLRVGALDGSLAILNELQGSSDVRTKQLVARGALWQALCKRWVAHGVVSEVKRDDELTSAQWHSAQQLSPVGWQAMARLFGQLWSQCLVREDAGLFDGLTLNNPFNSDDQLKRCTHEQVDEACSSCSAR